jgi:hypothetical protein
MALTQRTGEKQAKHPGFVIGLVLEDRRIAFAPSFEALEQELMATYELMVRVVNDIPRPEASLFQDDRYPVKYLKVSLKKKKL